jgi:hypothetical protein
VCSSDEVITQSLKSMTTAYHFRTNYVFMKARPFLISSLISPVAVSAHLKIVSMVCRASSHSVHWTSLLLSYTPSFPFILSLLILCYCSIEFIFLFPGPLNSRINGSCFLIWCSVVRLSPLGTSVNICPIVPAPDDRMMSVG